MPSTDMNSSVSESTGSAPDYLEFSEDLTEESITEKLKGYNDAWAKESAKLFPRLASFYKFYRDQEYDLNGQFVKVPIVFTTIEIETPFLLNNLFAQSDVVDCKANFDDSQDSDQPVRVKSYINDLIVSKDKGRSKALEYIKNFLIYGYSISKAYWNSTPAIDIDPVSKLNIAKPNSKADFYNVDPFAFAFDLTKETNSIQETQWCRERIFLSKSSMKEIRDNGLCGDFADDDMTSTEDKGKKTRHPDSKDTGTYYDEFYVRLWTKSHVNDPNTGEDTGESKTESKEYRIWLLGNNKVIKFQENIFGKKPYVVASCYPIPFSLIGMGEPEVIGGIANRLSLNNYQTGLLAAKIGKSPYLIGPNSGLMPYNLKLLEEGVLFSKDINDVKPLPSIDPENLEALIKFAESLQAEVESTTGVTKTLQGADVGDITATQAAIIEQTSTNRLAIKLEQLQENYMVPLAELLFLLTKQNVKDPQSIKSNGDLITLQPQDFFGNYTWVSTSPVTISNKALALQNNTALMGQLAQAAGASQSTPWKYVINYGAGIKKLIQPNLSVGNLDDIFVPMPPPPPPIPQPNPQFPSQGPLLSPQMNVGNPAGINPVAPTPSPFNSGPIPANSPLPDARAAEPHPTFRGPK